MVVEEEEAAIAGVVGMTVVVVAVEALELRARWKRGLETGTVHRKLFEAWHLDRNYATLHHELIAQF